MKYNFFVIILLIFCGTSFRKIEGSEQDLYGSNSIEFISNNYQMFINKIRLFNQGKIDKLRILQIGDSHLQGGVSASVIRMGLQQKFGNGGRGVVFPYSLAKTNGPKDYSFQSDGSWKSTWITHYPKLFGIGLPGIGIKSENSFGKIHFKLNEENQEFFDRGFFVYSFEKSNSGEVKLSNRFKKVASGLDFDSIQFSFPKPQKELELNFNGASMVVHNFYLENSNRGMVYSSVGVAGAMYKDYLFNDFFRKQLTWYNLDLLVISLGTNESYRKSYSKVEFAKTVDSMFHFLKTQIPQTSILITGPGENYFVKNGAPIKNERVKLINEVLRSKCEEYGFAIWDLYKTMGNEGGMLRWKDAGLVNNDHLHYLKSGYKLQGQLLLEAIEKTIN